MHWKSILQKPKIIYGYYLKQKTKKQQQHSLLACTVLNGSGVLHACKVPEHYHSVSLHFCSRPQVRLFTSPQSKLKVQNSKFKIQKSKSKVQSSKSKVQSSKSKVQSSKSKVQSPKFKVQSPKFKVQSSKFKVQSSKSKVQRTRLLAQTPVCLAHGSTLPSGVSAIRTHPNSIQEIQQFCY